MNFRRINPLEISFEEFDLPMKFYLFSFLDNIKILLLLRLVCQSLKKQVDTYLSLDSTRLSYSKCWTCQLIKPKKYMEKNELSNLFVCYNCIKFFHTCTRCEYRFGCSRFDHMLNKNIHSCHCLDDGSTEAFYCPINVFGDDEEIQIVNVGDPIIRMFDGEEASGLDHIFQMCSLDLFGRENELRLTNASESGFFMHNYVKGQHHMNDALFRRETAYEGDQAIQANVILNAFFAYQMSRIICVKCLNHVVCTLGASYYLDECRCFELIFKDELYGLTKNKKHRHMQRGTKCISDYVCSSCDKYEYQRRHGRYQSDVRRNVRRDMVLIRILAENRMTLLGIEEDIAIYRRPWYFRPTFMNVDICVDTELLSFTIVNRSEMNTPLVCGEIPFERQVELFRR